jgi:hypothetical protein
MEKEEKKMQEDCVAPINLHRKACKKYLNNVSKNTSLAMLTIAVQHGILILVAVLNSFSVPNRNFLMLITIQLLMVTI